MRVFVSSVFEDYQVFRRAAREAIERAGAEAILVNEDFPSLASSPRNACLDGVQSCDLLVAVLGERAGWVAPSGSPVVEEEIEHARRHGLPVLLFVQDCDRNDAAAALERRVSDFVGGQMRRTFRTPEELCQEILRALEVHSPGNRHSHQEIRDVIDDLLSTCTPLEQQVTLRVVLAPDRDEEVVRPDEIESHEFERTLQEIGHQVDLLSFKRAKDIKVTTDGIRLTQEDSYRHDQEILLVRVEVRESGILVIDSNVTGMTDYGAGLDGLVIVEADLRARLSQSLAFAAGLYEELDPYQRQARFHYGVSLTKVDFRPLVATPPRGGTGISLPMRMGPNGPVVAFEGGRPISRQGLKQPEAEIDRCLARFRRALSTQG